MLHLLQGTRSEQPPEFLEGAKRPLCSNWAPTGIAITRENSWIPEVHGSLKSRSGQLCALKSPLAHLTSLGPLSKISWGCSLSKRKDERWKPGLWPPQAQQEPWPKQEEGPAAGQRGRSVETSVGAGGIWKPVLGLYWLPSDSLLLTSLTRFIDAQFFIHPNYIMKMSSCFWCASALL